MLSQTESGSLVWKLSILSSKRKVVFYGRLVQSNVCFIGLRQQLVWITTFLRILFPSGLGISSTVSCITPLTTNLSRASYSLLGGCNVSGPTPQASTRTTT